MNLLARILSHGFAFAVVALIIVVLMYRGDLFEEWDLPDFLAVKGKPTVTEGSESGAVDRAPSAVVETGDDPLASTPAPAPVEAVADPSGVTPDVTPDVSAISPAPEPAATPDTSSEAGMAASSAEESDASPANEIEILSDDASDDASAEGAATSDSSDTAAEPATDSAATEETDSTDGIAASAAGEAESSSPDDASISADTAGDAAPAVPDAAATTADAAVPSVEAGEAETPYSVLAKGREAYWLRDFTTAEQHYQKLIQLEPGNPDGYGELGNMYFSRGMWDEAANAYYEAGVRLLDEGLVVQARQMVEVIRGLNGSQADKLDAQITAVSTTSP